jgi:nitrate reductase gamma subunit
MGIVFGMVLPYVAFSVFLGGTLLRISGWVAIPVPFHLTLFPVAKDKAGKVWEVMAEFLLCRTLYRGDTLLWLPVCIFHYSLLMVMCGHLLGICFLRDQFVLLGLRPESSRNLSVILGGVTGTMMALSLFALLCRRIFRIDVRRLSSPDSYVDLVLILSITLTGMLMYLPGFHVELRDVRAYMAGLLLFDPVPLPQSPVFITHFLLVNLLMLYFPFSRMLHSAGFFVNRLMLAEAPPVYPTPGHSAPRSDFAIRKTHPDIPFSHTCVADREARSQ